MVAKMADWFSRLSPFVKNVIIGFTALVAALGPAVLVIGIMSSAVAGLMPLLAGMATAVLAISAPIWGAVAAITAVIGVGVLLYQNWEKIISITDDLDKKLQEVLVVGFTFVVDSVKAGVEAITGFFSDMYDAVVVSKKFFLKNIIYTLKLC